MPETEFTNDEGHTDDRLTEEEREVLETFAQAPTRGFQPRTQMAEPSSPPPGPAGASSGLESSPPSEEPGEQEEPERIEST